MCVDGLGFIWQIRLLCAGAASHSLVDPKPPKQIFRFQRGLCSRDKEKTDPCGKLTLKTGSLSSKILDFAGGVTNDSQYVFGCRVGFDSAG